MNNNYSQTHTVKLKLHIKKLYLKVRFPCSVSFQLKNQLNFIETRTTYPLTDNIANINDALELQIDADYNSVNSRYDSKKLSLVVYMTSTNGKVIAGSVKFDPFEKSIGANTQCSVPLDKCPDKNAKIYFSYSFQFLSHSNQKFQKSSYSYIYELKHLSPRTNFSRNFIDSPPKTAILDYKKKPTDRSDRSRNHRSPGLTSNNYNNIRSYGTLSERYAANLEPESQLKHSQIQSEVVYKNKHPTDMSPGTKYHRANDTMKPYNVNGSKTHEYDLRSNNNESKNLNQSIRDKKNVQRLKAQFNFRHKQQVKTNENRIQLLKAQVDSLTLEIQNYKGKMRDCDKREKNSQLMVKELREEIDKRKSKELGLNSRISELEALLVNKEKQMKGLTNEKKLQEEDWEKERLKSRTQEKKQEIKIASLTQQLHKVDQKYKQCQKSRLQSTADYNNLLNQLQQSQKKQHGSIRDKEKLANEQRSKLNKKIDWLNGQIQQLHKKIEEHEENMGQMANEKKSLGKELSMKEMNIIALENAKQQLTLQLCKQAQQLRGYQKDIQAYKVIQVERNTLKKKLIQQQHQVNNMKEKNTRLQSSINSLNTNITSLQQKSKQSSNQKASLLSSESHFKRELQNQFLTIKKVMKQNESFQVDILQLNDLHSQTRLKLESANRYGQELRVEFDDKISIVLREKNSLESELGEYRWALDKEKQHLDHLKMRYSALNEDILNINEQLINKSQKMKKLEQHLSQQKIQHQSIKHQKSTLSTKVKQLSTSIKQREQQTHQLKKKLQQQQQQIYLLKDRLAHLEHTYKQKDERENKKHKEKEEIIDVKLSELEKAQMVINQVREELANCKQDGNAAKKYVEHWKFVYEQLTVDHQATSHKLSTTKHEKSLLQDELAQLQLNFKSKCQQSMKLQRNLQRSTQQLQQYKHNITQSLQKLLQQMSKQQQPRSSSMLSISLKGLIDPKLSKLQIQIIQKRNALILKYNSQVFQLEQSIELLKIETQKLRNTIESLEQEKVQLIQLHKDKLKQGEMHFKQQQEHYSHEITSLQDKLYQKMSDSEKLSIQVKKKSQLIQEQSVQIHILITQYESVQQENTQLQGKIHELKQHQLQESSRAQNKFNQISIHFEEIINRIREEMMDKERLANELEDKLEDKMQQFKKLQHLHNDQKFEKQKLLQLLHETHEKHQNLTTANQSITKRLKQQQKKSHKLHAQLKDLTQRLQSLQVKKEDLHFKNTKLDEQLMETHVEKQRLKLELDTCKEKNDELLNALKQKGQTDKSQLAKHLQQINSLRDTLLHANSQTDLKTFALKQLQQTINSLKKQIQSLNYELNKKKEELIDKSHQTDSLKSTLEDSYQKINRLQNDKNQLEMKLLLKNNALESMQHIINKKHLLQEQLEKRSKDLLRIKDQKTAQLSQKQRQSQKTKSDLKSIKAQHQKLKLTQDQLKKKNRQLEYLLQSSNLDLYEQKKKWTSTNQKEKHQIYKRIQTIQASKDTLEEQFKFEKQQMHKQIQALTSDYNEIVDKIKTLYEEKKQLEQALDKMNMKNQQLNHHLHKANKLSNTHKQQLQDYEKQTHQLKDQLKSHQTQTDSLIKKHSKLIQTLKLNIGFQKDKALITFNTSELNSKVESIFNSIDLCLKNTQKEFTKN